MIKVRKLMGFGFSTFLLLSIMGCSGADEREIEDYSYLDYEAIEHLESPREDGVYDKYEEAEKEIEDKFVRWTATFQKEKSDDHIRLSEKGLPRMDALFEKENMPENDFKKGDIVTVSCKSKGYNYVFWDEPRWWLEDCRVEETTDKEKKELLAYQKAVNERTKEIKEEKAMTQTEYEQKQKEEEAERIAEEAKQKEEEAKKLEEQKPAIKAHIESLFALEETVSNAANEIAVVAENGSIYEVYDQAKAVDEIANHANYKELSKIKIPEALPTDIEKQIKQIHEDYSDSFLATEMAAEKAMDFAESEKPSDFSKMKEYKERADNYILIAGADILELVTEVGLNIEDFQQ